MPARLLFILLLSILAILPARANRLLPTFAPEILAPARMTGVYAASDGRVYLSGKMTKLNGAAAPGPLVRLNADGSVDATFTLGATINGPIRRIVPLGDGRLGLIGGFTEIGGVSRPGVAILLADGALDPTFAPAASAVPAEISAIALDDDDRILVGGRSPSRASADGSEWVATGPVLVRLQESGAPDSTFTPPSASLTDSPNTAAAPTFGAGFILPMPSGQILFGGDFTSCAGQASPYLVLLQDNGAADSTFVSPLIGSTNEFALTAKTPGAYAVCRTDDGSIYVGGYFVLAESTSRQSLVKFRASDLSVDESFQVAFTAAYPYERSASVRQLAEASAGRMLVVGDFLGIQGTDFPGSAFVDAAGHPVGAAVGFDGVFSARADGSLVFARLEQTLLAGALQPSVRAYLASGAVDPAFAPRILGPGSPTVVLARAGGSLLVGGRWLQEVNGADFPGFVALGDDGTLDSTFQVALTPPNSLAAAVALPEGGYLLAGTFTQVNGQPSPSFAVVDATGQLVKAALPTDAPNRPVDGATLLPSGLVAVRGDFSALGEWETEGIAVLDPSPGTEMVDTSFQCGVTGLKPILGVAGLADGRIVTAGSFYDPSPTGVIGLARFSTTGAYDRDYRPLAGHAFPDFQSLELDPAGRLLLGGTVTAPGGAIRHLLRLHADGTVDAAFPSVVDAPVQAAHTAADFRIYADTEADGATGAHRILRLSGEGVRDPLFDIAGTGFEGFLVGTDRIYVWGRFTDLAGQPRTGLGAYELEGEAPTPTPTPSPTATPRPAPPDTPVVFPKKVSVCTSTMGVVVSGRVSDADGVAKVEIFIGKKRIATGKRAKWKVTLPGNPSRWKVRVTVTDLSGRQSTKTYVVKNSGR